MGKGNRRKVGADQFDSSDTDSVSSTSTAFSELTLANETEHVNSLEFVLDKYIDALYEKRYLFRFFDHQMLSFPPTL